MEFTGLTERKLRVARALGAGYSERYVAAAEEVSRGTIQRWKKEPAFAAEVARARESTVNPSPRGTLTDALTARRDDQVDWPSRVKAALALIELDRRPGVDDPDDVEPSWVT